MRRWLSAGQWPVSGGVILLAGLAVGLAWPAGAQTTPGTTPPTTPPPAQSYYGAYDALSGFRRDLTYRLQDPMAEGRDVTAALECWFAAEKLIGQDKDAEREAIYRKGFAALRDPQPLPAPKFADPPANVELKLLEPVPLTKLLFDYAELPPVTGVSCRILQWPVGELKQYGVMIAPEAPGKYPLVLYLHGAAFGVPSYALPWLARLAANGYVIVGPALRGEDLFPDYEVLDLKVRYRCDGQIENLLGEVDDALALVAGAARLESVAGDRFAIVAHSFGAGVGLMVAARSPKVTCMVSYDAWLANPFRYYWDRLRDGPNNWLSWEDYTKQPVAAQLQGLMARSAVHNAGSIKAPLLLFMGGGYNGSVFHQSHADLVNELKRQKKEYRYEIIPNGGHNFVLYYNSPPAREAYALQTEWLNRHHPPKAPVVAPPKP